VLIAAALLVAVGASGASVGWHDLRSVRVTVSKPSLPPPAGEAQTTSFRTHQQLARAQAALNANGIRRLATDRSRANGCTGGFDVVIRIVERDSTRVTLEGYRCANEMSGNLGGDLLGFLSALDISPPG
jgi:hypothetical protein